MEISYWQSRWKKEKTGWHMETVYPQLPKLWPQLNINKNAEVFVPLCGKSKDLDWLADQGCHVTGIDVSEKAIKSLIDNFSAEFEKEYRHGFTIYQSDKIELWNGDFFKFPAEDYSAPDLIYDKAAMIALPPDMRPAYAQKLLQISGHQTKIFLQTFEYDQNEMNGPPFSVPEKEIRKYFGEHFSLTLLHKESKFDDLAKFQRRGLSSFLDEKIFLLHSE